MKGDAHSLDNGRNKTTGGKTKTDKSTCDGDISII